MVVAEVANHLNTVEKDGHPLRVAVDGITAAGKTTFAAEITAALRTRGRTVIDVSMDGFHHPRAHRYRQGRDSARGYYEDAYDFATFAKVVLSLLGPRGDRRYRPRIIDLPTDTPVDEPPQVADPRSILVVDGSFLQRELSDLWDVVVFVNTSFDTAKARGALRDAAQFGSQVDAEDAYRTRYRLRRVGAGRHSVVPARWGYAAH
ncbi:uridine kinase [Rhodococcus globerulus]|uniref:Uridine kinase n=1 Tax=Rhodococcus globerulus TaxID=33008 RepID=A0ABU4C479_RHOGO|nr:uridine kinase [Rhodococcus globerulus]MDV6271188.1 uridine kinase [Rhodococcus globerulus]